MTSYSKKLLLNSFHQHMKFIYSMAILSTLLLLNSCVDTPSETKVVKEKVTDTEIKRVTFEDKAKIDKIELIITKGHLPEMKKFASKDMLKGFDAVMNEFDPQYNKQYKRNVISISGNFILDAPIYEIQTEFVEKIIQTKKLSQYSYNPMGALTSSVLMLGTIEAWCLIEWMSNALPGEQKNIYLKDCKEFYFGNKKNRTETYEREKAVTDTGETEKIEKKIEKGKVKISVNNDIIAVYHIKKFNDFIYLSDFINDLPGTHRLQSTRSVRLKIEVEVVHNNIKKMRYTYILLPKDVIDYEMEMKSLYPNN